MSGDKKTIYVCKRCAGQGPTCCRLNLDDGEDCFPLSEPELKRIRDALKEAASMNTPDAHQLLDAVSKARDAFTGNQGYSSTETNSSDFIETMRTLFPKNGKMLAERFPAGKKHKRLTLVEDGKCVFLGDSGCLLPAKARPWFCLVFPFWMVNGQLQCFLDDDCLAVRENRNLAALTQAFGLSRDEIVARYQGLCRDWGLTRD